MYGSVARNDFGGEWNMVRQRGVFAGGGEFMFRVCRGRVWEGKMVFSRERERGDMLEAVERERPRVMSDTGYIRDRSCTPDA